MGGIAGGFDFCTLLGESGGGVARIANRAVSEERKDADESKASDWQFVGLVLKVRAEGRT